MHTTALLASLYSGGKFSIPSQEAVRYHVTFFVHCPNQFIDSIVQ